MPTVAIIELSEEEVVNVQLTEAPPAPVVPAALPPGPVVPPVAVEPPVPGVLLGALPPHPQVIRISPPLKIAALVVAKLRRMNRAPSWLSGAMTPCPSHASARD